MDVTEESAGVASGPPAWALAFALVVSGNIFDYWALIVTGEGPTVALAVVGLLLRLVGLGMGIRWVLGFRVWWAYAIAAVLAAGMVHAIMAALSHLA